MKSRSKLQPECRSTRYWPWISLLLAVSGCGSPPSTKKEAISAEEPKIEVQTVVQVPGFADSVTSNLELVVGEGRVGVGDDVNRAVRQLTRPKTASTVSKTAPYLDASFSVVGWETDTTVYAIVHREGKVVLAMNTEDGLDKDRATEALNQIAGDAIQPVEISGGRVHYLFWEGKGPFKEGENRIRAMIGTIEVKPGEYRLVKAIGPVALMERYHMSPTAAQDDLIEANKHLRAADEERKKTNLK